VTAMSRRPNGHRYLPAWAGPALLALVAAAVAPAPAEARSPWQFGLRAGIYTDPTDVLVGIDATYPLRSDWSLVASLDAVLGDDDAVVLGADFAYDLVDDGEKTVWLGAGPAIVVVDHDRGDRETDPGLSLLAGVKLKTAGSLQPILQGRVVVSDDTRASIAVGVRF